MALAFQTFSRSLQGQRLLLCSALCSAHVNTVAHQRGLFYKKRVYWKEEYLHWLYHDYKLNYQELKSFLYRKQLLDIKEIQQFDEAKAAVLGPDLAVAEIVIKLGGKVKFFDDDIWYQKFESGGLPIPTKFEEGYHVEAIDASNIIVFYDCLEYFNDGLDVRPKQYVHEDCRKDYCYDYNKKRKLQDSTNDMIRSPKTRKLAGRRFLYENNCVLCGTNVENQNENKLDEVYDIVHRVETFDFQISIKTLCKTRNDDWANEILGRIEGVNDLPAAEARYHQSCNSNFRTYKNIPEKYRPACETDKKGRGRPSNATSMKAFLDTMQYFECHENEQLSVVDLVNIMSERCGNDSYSSVYMKKKILEYFGENIIMAEINGKQDVVTFKSEAHAILHAFYKRSKSDECTSEKEAIITTAARFILNDIKSMDKCKDMYPQASQITALDTNLEYLPDSLQLLLQNLIDNKQGKKKIASIGQSIVQTATPRSILCPLQLGLGVMVHHMSGSKMLVDCLSSLGDLQHIRFICLSKSKYVDDWYIEKIIELCPNIEALDISDCPKITDNGLEMVHHLKNLKVVNITNCHKIKCAEAICAHLEEFCPDLTVIGLDSLPKLQGSTGLHDYELETSRYMNWGVIMNTKLGLNNEINFEKFLESQMEKMGLLEDKKEPEREEMKEDKTADCKEDLEHSDSEHIPVESVNR